MRRAVVGEPVFVLLDPDQNNGSAVAPAWVVSAWGEPYTVTGRQAQSVNVRVVMDGPDVLWITSIKMFDERPTPEELAALDARNPNGYRTVCWRRGVV